MDDLLRPLRRYADFSGRARRREYWLWSLLSFVISLLEQALAAATRDASSGVMTAVSVLYLLVALGLFLPGLAVGVRRLHDVGRSGWWLLIGLIPLVGPLILLVWFITGSEPGENAWGPDPTRVVKTLTT